MNRMITLQVNTAGAWRNVLTFASHRAPAMREAVKALQAAADTTAKWCFLDDGRREWLPEPLASTFAQEKKP
ncbi:MAG: hypothetical protein WBW32_10840 [Luteibacter sp.]